MLALVPPRSSHTSHFTPPHTSSHLLTPSQVCCISGECCQLPCCEASPIHRLYLPDRSLFWEWARGVVRSCDFLHHTHTTTPTHRYRAAGLYINCQLWEHWCFFSFPLPPAPPSLRCHLTSNFQWCYGNVMAACRPPHDVWSPGQDNFTRTRVPTGQDICSLQVRTLWTEWNPAAWFHTPRNVC